MYQTWEEALKDAKANSLDVSDTPKKQSKAAQKQSFIQKLKQSQEERKLRRELGNFYHEKAFIAKYREVQNYLLEQSGQSGFFDPTQLLSLDTLYFVVFGERSNGKTFAVLVIAFIRYALYGEKFAYIRRWDLDLTPRRIEGLFGAFSKFNLISFITEGEYTFIHTYQRCFYLGRWPQDDELDMCNAKHNGIDCIREPDPFGYCFALNNMEHDKGGNQPPEITTILFDEFMSRQRYLADELTLFSNVISSIKRTDGRFKVWMLGNTVTTYCPYFREMGLKHITEMKKGETQTYQGSDPSTTIAVHWAGSPDGDAKTEINKFFAFDNPRLKMITEGSFETADYPKCPRELDDEHLAFVFFLCFDSDVIQGNIYAYPDGEFIFWNPKTTELKHPDEDLIYSDQYDYRNNWRSSFKNPQTKEEAALIELINRDKMFFADNQTGETLRNFIINSKSIIQR